MTHHRIVVKARRLAAQEKRVLDVYSIDAATYDAIYEIQGGRCEICRRASGARKRLSVDHDHSCCNGPRSCGQCVRGLLCSTCNKMLGHLRDDPVAFERAVIYLNHWPSRRIRPVSSSTRSAPSASASATTRSARAGSSAAGARATGS